jgi:hypothetical protein
MLAGSHGCVSLAKSNIHIVNSLKIYDNLFIYLKYMKALLW